jgi:hypothetical protein
VLYSLERPDGALRNAELETPPIRRRYFRLAIDEKGGGLGGGAPALEVAWLPEQLVFVARGAGTVCARLRTRARARGAFRRRQLIRSALPPAPIRSATCRAPPRRSVPSARSANPAVLVAHREAGRAAHDRACGPCWWRASRSCCGLVAPARGASAPSA